MHQVLRLLYPFLSSRSLLGRLGTPSHLGKKGSSSGSPTLSPTRFYLVFQSLLLHPGFGQGDPGLQDSKQILDPWLLPYHIPLSHSSPEQQGWEEEVVEGRKGWGDAQLSSTRTPKLSPRAKPVLLISVSSP